MLEFMIEDLPTWQIPRSSLEPLISLDLTGCHPALLFIGCLTVQRGWANTVRPTNVGQ